MKIQKSEKKKVELFCPSTTELHEFVAGQDALSHLSLDNKTWIFGLNNQYWNPIVWVINFAIYKSHILACEGHLVPLLTQAKLEVVHYGHIFPCLLFIDW